MAFPSFFECPVGFFHDLNRHTLAFFDYEIFSLSFSLPLFQNMGILGY